MLTLLMSRFALSANSTNSAASTKSAASAVQPPFIEPPLPQSTFSQPRKQADGRDPFFPKSVRPFGESAKPKTTPIPAPITELALKGISGTPEQPLAIINNRTLAAGEEADVLIGAGKIRIRCVEIKMSEGTVLVQVGGQSRELRLTQPK